MTKWVERPVRRQR